MLARIALYQSSAKHIKFNIVKCHDIKGAVLWAQRNYDLIKDQKGTSLRTDNKNHKYIKYTINRNSYALDVMLFNIRTPDVVGTADSPLRVSVSAQNNEFPLYIKNLKLKDGVDQIYDLNYVISKNLFIEIARAVRDRITGRLYCDNHLSLLSINNNNHPIGRDYEIGEDDVIKYCYKSVWDSDINKYWVEIKKAEVIDIRKKEYRKEEKVKKVVKKSIKKRVVGR